jgi:nuclear pore complex protein Nup53
MDGVVEPTRTEVLSLPAPPPVAEAQSPVTPAQTSAKKTEPVANGGDVDGEEWVTVFGLVNDAYARFCCIGLQMCRYT